MARRKNVKRIDPRYFLHETVNRGEEDLEEGCPSSEETPPEEVEDLEEGILEEADWAKAAWGSVKKAFGNLATNRAFRKAVQNAWMEMLKDKEHPMRKALRKEITRTLPRMCGTSKENLAGKWYFGGGGTFPPVLQNDGTEKRIWKTFRNEHYKCMNKVSNYVIRVWPHFAREHLMETGKWLDEWDKFAPKQSAEFKARPEISPEIQAASDAIEQERLPGRTKLKDPAGADYTVAPGQFLDRGASGHRLQEEMKISRAHLKQIIKEELSAVMEAESQDTGFGEEDIEVNRAAGASGFEEMQAQIQIRNKVIEAAVEAVGDWIEDEDDNDWPEAGVDDRKTFLQKLHQYADTYAGVSVADVLESN